MWKLSSNTVFPTVSYLAPKLWKNLSNDVWEADTLISLHLD